MAAGYEDLQAGWILVKERAEAFSVKWVNAGGFRTAEVHQGRARRFAREMNEWSESLGEKDLRLVYHPHGYEFVRKRVNRVDVCSRRATPRRVF